MSTNNIKIGFFGGPAISIITLDWIFATGYEISFIVTTPDRPKGRKLIMTPPPAKTWGIERNIPILQPENLRDENFINELKKFNCDVFVVMAYGKLIPEEILNIPKGKSLNIHPSLLPRYRGPSPLESAILADDDNTGCTIIRMDKFMDHGPIIWQKEYAVYDWPLTTDELGEELVDIGSNALVLLLPAWLSGEIPEIEQNDKEATFTKKIVKEDGLIDLDDDPYKNYLKIMAYSDWPSIFFFKGNQRIKITKASFVDGKLIIEKVIPEGKGETNWTGRNGL